MFKTGKPNNLTNYRPISILTCFSKIIEKLIHKRLSSFFEKLSILAKTQYGFQAGKSTSHAILDVLTTAYEHINNNEYTGLVRRVAKNGGTRGGILWWHSLLAKI